MNRRKFISTAATAAAAVSLPARSWSQVQGANSEIRVGVVGFNGRGKSHIGSVLDIPGTRLVALCDADKAVLNRETQGLERKNVRAQGYTDIRQLLENKDVDVISIATPNHWHSLMGIWSCQAGKDVYVEKPVSHNVFEGRKLVEAARQYKRIVQTGTQSRSSTGLREALEWVKAGNIGKIKVARGLCYKRRPSIGKVTEPTPIPPDIDYDLWCGPAPKVPLMRKNLHYDWHWVWDTGNGDLGNQGIHQMDIIRWAAGKDHLSPKVMSLGGRFGYIDDGQTANTQIVVHDYGDLQLIFEVRGLPEKPDAKEMDKFRTQSVGHIIECEGGYLAGTTVFDKENNKIKTFNSRENHYENFIQAVRSRKVSDLHADILEGHYSSALCHTGNISYRLGMQMDQGAIREKIKSNPAALETLGRMEEHLAANLVDLKKTPVTLGPFLEMDPKTEKFTNSKEANALLTRPYRPPYIVPEKV